MIEQQKVRPSMEVRCASDFFELSRRPTRVAGSGRSRRLQNFADNFPARASRQMCAASANDFFRVEFRNSRCFRSGLGARQCALAEVSALSRAACAPAVSAAFAPVAGGAKRHSIPTRNARSRARWSRDPRHGAQFCPHALPRGHP